MPSMLSNDDLPKTQDEFMFIAIASVYSYSMNTYSQVSIPRQSRGL